IAIGRAILTEDPSARLLYIGTKKGLEREVVPREGFAFVSISSGGVAGKSPVKAARNILLASAGVAQSLVFLLRFRPHVVIGTGGYVSAPVIFAAYLLRIPILLQEQNVLPGVTTRFLSRLAREVALPFPESRQYMPDKAKCFVSGNPVRPDLVNTTRQEAARRLGLDPGKKTLLVMGGSRGARCLAELGMKLIAFFSIHSEFQMILITGKEYYGEVLRTLEKEVESGDTGYYITEERARAKENVVIIPYMHDIGTALAITDLALARAGAMTISEFLELGIPSILVPSPNVARNHQEYNAKTVERRGAAIVISEARLDYESLSATILSLLGDEGRLSTMAKAAKEASRPGAASHIAKRAMSLAFRRFAGG
ncbi:MAG TPA: UDP-N-acetylglucosamine--N-acetylmuramyl-(pentapeptide) pyrophosphoryl-undecaprenol N-acetylglucosamine transferase, partial [Clostridia bacterium]|nr:UDP-N-acetylglucosamine--N-acetylmuramyl-(pentapeptide) pyrophosphoryl-undecaprenol N-acetylglucosamine transferase [Clostridia bacterium]